ncbi:MAG: aldo/keto reductase [Granulosicoccus sp.]|nr:aldo/keto reductase [Granulosicoccus sp.]
MTRPAQTEIRPDYKVSSVIKGGWQLAGDHGSVEQQRAIDDMLVFYDAGITTFDCADIYTGVEEMLGQFRQRLHNERGSESTKQIRIHTKYVPDIAQLATLNQQDVESIIDRSLQRLQQEQLDLVQFHWWDYETPGLLDAIMYLDELRRSGKIKHIGITNFDAEHLEILCNHVDVASAQIQFSLLDRRAEQQFTAVAANHNVHLFCYGVLAGGFLTDHWLNQTDPGMEFENRSLVKYRLIIEEFGGWELFQQLLQVLRAVADRHKVDISSIAIGQMLNHPAVTSTIVGARYAHRLPHTLRAIRLKLSEQDKAEIATITDQAKGPLGTVFGLERDTTGRHGRIMKYNLNSGDSRQMRQR